jgi:hypothetical protein
VTDSGVLHIGNPGYQVTAILDRVIISGSVLGRAIHIHGESDATLTCCDLHGNEGGDWVGAVFDQYGIAGNISEDPLFCNPEEGDVSLHSDSPCAWSNNPECGYIGARPVGCGETASATSDPLMEDGITKIVPNPSRGAIEIGFIFPLEGRVSAKVLDVTGRVVRHLFEGSYPSVYAGDFSLAWDGLDDQARRVPSGVYITRVESPDGVTTGLVVLAR